jgi:hypothetical protein
MADRVRINIDSKEFERTMRAIQRLDRDHEKELRKILRDAVKIASDKINSTIYNRAITKRSGKLGKAMGAGTFKSEAKGYIGGKSRPKRASKSNGGWRVHFFASPASQMDKKYRFDFQQKYNSVIGKVRSKFLKDFDKLVEKALK